MDTPSLFKQGDLAGLHAQVAEEIRKNPQEAASRALFVQILCMEGEWERANRQADALLKLSPASAMFCTTISQLIRAERSRESVFSGQTAPLWVGAPPAWSSSLAEALSACAAGEKAKGASATAAILDALPVIPVTLSNGTRPWLLDGDARLAGVLELITGDTYRLVEQASVQSLEIAAPTHPVELLWPHVRLQLRHGETLIGRMPGRYPLSGKRPDAQLLMMRSTSWEECDGGQYLGSGQRCWNTDEGLIPMLSEPHLLFG